MSWNASQYGLAVAVGLAVFAQSAVCAAEGPADGSAVAKAVSAGLKVLEKGTINYQDSRDCFSCHHQTLPMLAQVTARTHGFKINEDLFQKQARITYDGFKDRRKQLREGTGIGGGTMTVGYALWALDLAGQKPDDTTEAMVAFLLKKQRKDGRFDISSTRPPLEDSPATSLTVAAYTLRAFATEAQKAPSVESIDKARSWLARHEPKSQEDRNSRLWGMHFLEAGAEEIAGARAAVLEAQGEDGSWSQLPEMTGDSYATGQTLWMLRESGLPTSDSAYQRGVNYLLHTQREDGSWLVPTRSKPIQRYYESGFPHGKDQFISISGTAWAVAALAATHPPAEVKRD